MGSRERFSRFYFSWSRWLRSWFHGSKGRPYVKKRRLQMEQLETRLAPATYTWDGGGGNSNTRWSDAANWSTNVAPSGSAVSLDNLVFPTGVSGNSMNDLVGATFNSITISGSNYTLGGNALTLGSSAISSGNSIIVNANDLGDSISFNIQMAGQAGGRQFLIVNTGGALTISGKLTGTSGLELAKNGTGTLVLSGNNSGFTGPIDVVAGDLQVTNATALGNASSNTTVESGADLQVSSATGITVNEPLILNGAGPQGNGALLNVKGNNTWSGSVEMDTDTTFGATAGTLNITGVITDTGTGHNLTKVGAGTIIFSGANTYRGTTTVDNGILGIGNALALGTADGTAATETVVNSTITASGTLEFNNVTGKNFTIVNELLVLNGPGYNPGTGALGALYNAAGNNTWAGTVVLGSPPPAGSNVSIGAAAAGGTITNLLISGVIKDPASGGPFNLTKIGAGRLILTNGGNSYLGSTTVAGGILNVEDSQALGPLSKPVSTVTVRSSASLDLQLQSDNIAGLVGTPVLDSVTGSLNKMKFAYPLNLTGTGANNTGALLSVSGINIWSGNVQLNGAVCSIGVAPDPNTISPAPGYNPSQYFTNDYSLTVTGGSILGVNATTFAKVGTGQLILPTANSYDGPTDIQQGWITIQNNNSLGQPLVGVGDTAQPSTTVEAGAALHIRPLTAASLPLDIRNNLILNSTGIVHPFSMISQEGALMNLGGNNVVSGNIQLNGNVGIGVQDLGPVSPSELTLTGVISQKAAAVLNINGSTSGTAAENDNIIDTGSTSGTITVKWNMFKVPDDLRIYDPPQPGGTLLFDSGLVSYTGSATVPYNNPLSTDVEIIMNEGGNPKGTKWTYTAQITPDIVNTAGGIIKLGEKRLDIQGQGTYDGNVEVREGVLRAQSDTALGAPGTGTVTVDAGTALELAPSPAAVPVYGALTGGISAGIQVFDKTLILNGTGNTSVNQGGSNATILPLTNDAGDNVWRGPVTLDTDTTIDTGPNSRLTLFSTVDDAANPNPLGSNLTKIDTGELVLDGINTYRGLTTVSSGVLTVGGDQALGTTGSSEVEAVTVPGASGTSFTLTFDGQTTGSLANNATAAQVQAALNGLSTIGGADVGGSVSVNQLGNVYDVTFLGGLSGFQQTLTAGGTAGATVSEVTRGTGGTIVQAGASLEMQGNITIAGESLQISGQGVAAVPNVPQTWFNVGPAPVTNGGVFNAAVPNTTEAVTGRINGIAVDPSDPNVIYIAAADGGAWKTEDGGQTWIPLFLSGPTGAPIYAGAIAISPSDPRVIYLGTGDAQDGQFGIGTGPYGMTYYGSGVYKSTDSGRTWILLQNPGTFNPLYGAAVSRIAVDPSNPNLIYVSTSDNPNDVTNEPVTSGNVGVWRFDGVRWSNLTDITSVNRNTNKGKQMFPPGTPGPDDDYRFTFPQSNASWSDLVLDNNGTLYAALGSAEGDPNNAVFRCPNPTSNQPVWYMGDGGVDTETSKEFPGGNNGNAVDGNIKITAVGTTIYAAISNPTNSGAALASVQVSTDGGMTWAGVKTQPYDYLSTQGDYDSTIIASPTNPNIVYVGGADDGTLQFVLETLDGGTTWNSISVDATNHGPHTDLHASAVDQNGDLLVAGDGGIWKTNPNPTQASVVWNDLNGNLDLIQFLGLDVNPSDPNQAIGGNQDNGTVAFNGTLGWTQVDGGDGGPVRIDPSNPSFVYHEINAELERSTTGTAGPWTDILDVNNGPTRGLFFPFVLDNVNTSRLLVGTNFPNGGGAVPGAGTTLQESLDQGNTWIDLSQNLPAGYSVQDIAIPEYQGTWQNDSSFPDAPDMGANTYDPNTIYVSDGNSVMVTKDGAAKWADRTGNLTGTIVDLEVDPRNRDTVYAVTQDPTGTGTQIFMTTTAGQVVGSNPAWTNITYNLSALPAWKLVIDPRNGNVYVGNDIGVSELPNGSSTWQPVGVGLPQVQVRNLVLNQALNTLTAGTYGLGMYQLFIDGTQASGGALTSVSGDAIWAGPIQLAGDTTIGAAGSQALQNGLTAASLDMVGSIGDLNAGTTPRLTKIGGGNVILSGANTYAGITEVQQGVLVVDNPQALGSPTAGTIVDLGTALELQSSLVEEPITLNGSGFAFDGHNTGSLVNISGSNSYDGVLTLNSNATIGVASGTELTIGGSTFNLTFGVNGTQPLMTADASGLTGTNTTMNVFTAVTGTPTTQAMQTICFSGSVTGGTFTLTFNGATTAPIPWTANAAVLATSIQNALNALTPPNVVNLGNPNSDQIQFTYPGVQNTMIVNGGNLTGVNPSVGVTTTTPGTTATNAVQTISFTGTITGGTFTLSFNGASTGPITYPGAADPNLATDLRNNIQSALTQLLGQIAGGTGAAVSPLQTATIKGAFALTKEGTGTLVMAGTDTYGLGSGAIPSTVVNAGILNLQNGSGLGAANSNNLTQVLDGAQLQMQGNFTVSGQRLQISGTGIFGTGVLQAVDDGTATTNAVWAGPVFLAQDPGFSPATNPSSNVVFGVPAAADDLTINGPINQLAGLVLGLWKVGAGTLTLQQVDSYTGGTDILAGWLNAQDSEALGPSSPATTVTVNTGAALQLQANPAHVDSVTGTPNLKVTATVNVNGTGPTNAGGIENVSGANTWSGPVVLQSNTFVGVDAGASLTITNTNKGGVQNPTVIPAPPANLTKVGTGTLILANADTYTGNTFINQGDLRIADPGALGSTEVQLVTVTGSSGTFALTFNGKQTGNLAYNVPASGGVGPTASLQNALNALTTVNGVGGSVTVTQSGNVYTVTFLGTLASAYQPKMSASFAGGANAVVATSIIGDGGTVVAAGASLQLQGGINEASEAVTLNGTGFNNAGALENFAGTNTWSSPITLGTSSFIGVDNASDKLIIPVSISDGGAGLNVTEVGAGSLDYKALNSYTGLTQVDQGTLLLDNATGSPALSGNLIAGVIAEAIVTFQSNGAQPTLVPNGAGLTGTSPLVTVTTTTAGTAANAAVQTITFGGIITGGTFTLQFGGGTSTPIAWTPNTTNLAANIQTALTPLLTPLTVNTAAVTGPLGTAQWTNKNQLAANSTDIIYSNGVMNLNAQQDTLSTLQIIDGQATTGGSGSGSLTVNTLLNMSGGTITLGAPLSQLILGANANVTAAAHAATAVITGPGTVALGSAGHTITVNPTTYTITFQANGVQPSISADGSGLIGTSPTAKVVTTTTGSIAAGTVDTITFGGTILGGSFTLTYNGVTTLPITWSANAATLVSNIQTALNRIVPPQVAPGVNSTDVITFPFDGFQSTLLTLGTYSLTGGAGVMPVLNNVNGTAGTPAVQTLSFAGTPTGGTFNLVYGTEPPATVAWISDPGVLASNVQFAVSELLGTQVAAVSKNVPNTTDLDIQAALIGSGGLAINGGGRLQLDANNVAYTGLTTINAGEVEVDGSIGNVALAGGSVAGNGHVGTVDDGPPAGTPAVGFINPGDNGTVLPNGPGGILNTKTVTLGAASTYFVDLNNASNGPGPKGYDQLDVTGNITLTNATLAGEVGPNVAIGDSFTIIQTSGGTVSGQFADPYGTDTNGEPIVFFGTGKFDIDYSNPTRVVLMREPNDVSITVTSSQNPSIYGQDVSFTAMVTPEPGAGILPLGDSVTFQLSQGAFLIKQSVPLVFIGSGDQAVFDPQLYQNITLQPNTYTLTATYNGDTFFSVASVTLTPSQQVNQDSTSIALTAIPAAPAFGQAVTISVAVSPVTAPLTPGSVLPTGTVNFYLDTGLSGTPYQANVPIDPSGHASIVIANLSANLHLVDAAYSGDTNYAGVSTGQHTSISVQKDATAVTVSSNPVTTTLGQTVTFTATVAAAAPGSGSPSGSVQFYDGTLPGGASLGTETLGLATITFQNPGFQPMLVATGNGLTGANPSVNVTTITQGSAGTASVQMLSFGGVVSGGSFILSYGSSTSGAIPWSTDAPTLQASLQAALDGLTGSGATQVTMSPSVAEVSVSSLTVGVTGGTPPGHTITVAYSGDSNFKSNTGALANYNVGKGASNAVVTASGPVVFRQAVTFTATVNAVAPAAAVPSGSVQFVIDGSNQGAAVTLNGTGPTTATLAVSTLSAGLHSIDVVYSGNGNLANTTSPSLIYAVSQASSKTVVSSPGPVVYGQTVVFTASVTAVLPGAGTPTGTVTFDIDSIPEGIGSLVSGVATFADSSLSVSTGHVVTAFYTGDGNFQISDNTLTPFNQVVGKATTGTTLTPTVTVVTDQPITFTASVNPVAPGNGAPTGSVTFVVDNGNLSPAATVTNGVATFVDPGLSAGTHTVSAVYGGDGNFFGSGSSNVNQAVNKASTATVVSGLGSSAYGQAVTFTATISASLPGGGTPTGNVTFVVDNVNQSSAATLNNGQATFVDSVLGVGPHTIAAIYPGDNNYLGSNDTSTAFSQTVSKSGTNTSVSSSGATRYGQPATFTASITAAAPGAGTPTGQVTFVIDGIGQTPLVTLSGGQAILVDSALNAGAHSIVALYGGDSNFSGSGNSGFAYTQTVLNALTSTTVTSSGTMVFGQPVTFTASVAAQAPGAGTPTGSVTFAADGTNLSPAATVNGSGIATFVDSALATGTRQITASYGGDGLNFAPSNSGIFNQTVGDDTTKTTVSSSGSSVYGQTVTFTATVVASLPGSGLPTGTVTFAVDGTQQSPAAFLSGGVATFTDSALAVGTRSITALYSGNGSFFPSSNATPLSQVVSQAATNTQVTVSPNPAGSSTPVTFTATITAVGPGAGTPTGTVTFLVDGNSINPPATVNAGLATYVDSALTVGLHQIAANYSGDTNFSNSNGTASPALAVGKAASTTTVTTSGGSTYGQAVTFTATVGPFAPASGTPTGTVTFSVDGAPQSPAAVLSGGIATFIDTTLTAGSRQITATYGGDSNFFPSSTSSPWTQNVARAGSKTTVSSSGTVVFGQPVIFTATISPVAPATTTPTGSVTFVVDGHNQSPVATVSGGLATFADSALSAGGHSIAAIYGGDSNFFGSDDTTSTFSQSVGQDGSKTTVTSSGTVVYGQAVTFSATVTAAAPGSGTPTGPVTFAVDGTPQSPVPTLNGSGIATFVDSALSVGSHHITAIYGGDSNFATSNNGSTPLLQIVGRDGSTTSVTTSGATVYGQPATFTATVAAAGPGAGAPSGSVTFAVDGVQQSSAGVSGGIATVVDTALTAGNHNITATYSGDTNFTGSNDNTTPAVQSVGQALTGTTLTASANPAGYAQTVTFTASISVTSPGAGTPTGTVTFTIDSTPVSPPAPVIGGIATYATSSLSMSTHTIVATYSGDSNFASSGGSGASAINEQILNDSATTVSSTVNASVFGQSVTFSATVSPVLPATGTPTGSVTFVIDTVSQPPVNLISGVATFATSTLLVGQHNVSVNYGGDPNFVSSSGSLTQVVNRAGTTTTVTAQPASPVYGQTVVLTASVAPVSPGAGTPTGTVTFSIDGTSQSSTPTLSSGVATLAVTALNAGNHTIQATYNDDTNFAGSGSNSLNYSVATAATSTSVSPSGPTVFGQAVTLTALVTTSAAGAGTPTGTVQFLVDGANQGLPATLNGSGHATIVLTTLSGGAHTIKANFLGSTNFGSSSNSTSYTVGQDSTSAAVTASSGSSAAFGQTVTFTASITNTSTSQTPTGNVQFVVDGTPGSQLPLNNSAQATLVLSSLAVGPHTIAVNYFGNGNFAPSSNTTTPFNLTVTQAATSTVVSAAPNPASPGQAVIFTATVTTLTPGSGTPTGTVTFFVNGNSVGTGSLSSGKATFSTSSLTAGTYTITAGYGNTASFAASTSAGTSVRVATPTTTKLTSSLNPLTVGKTVKFTATVNSTTASGTITFVIDGNTQVTVPLTSGKASLSLSTLSFGGHKIQAIYSGDASFNGSTSATLTETVFKKTGRRL